MRTTQTKKIKTLDGELEVSVTQLPATESVKFLAFLGRTLGPGIVGLLGKDTSETSIAKAIEGLFEKLSDETIDMLIAKLLKGAAVQYNGATVQLADHLNAILSGDLLAVFDVLAFSLRVNYGPFSGALVERFGLDLARAQKAIAALRETPTSGPANA